MEMYPAVFVTVVFLPRWKERANQLVEDNAAMLSSGSILCYFFKSNPPVITLMSGTLSGDRSTVLAFLSKASLNILFLVADPHNRYRPTK